LYDTIIDEFDDDVSPTTEENFSKLAEDSSQAGATAPAAKEEPQPAVVKSRKKGEAKLPSSEDNESWSEDLQIEGDGPDYLVCPDQPWLDGFNTGDGSIRQFVAMPLGLGYTVEGQVTGKEENGGVQLRAFPARQGLFREPPPTHFTHSKQSTEIPGLSDEAMKKLLNRLTELGHLKPEEKSGILLEAEKGGASIYNTLESWGCLKDMERVLLEVGCRLFEFAEADFD
jgi:hypothetical protein